MMFTIICTYKLEVDNSAAVGVGIVIVWELIASYLLRNCKLVLDRDVGYVGCLVTYLHEDIIQNLYVHMYDKL